MFREGVCQSLRLLFDVNDRIEFLAVGERHTIGIGEELRVDRVGGK